MPIHIQTKTPLSPSQIAEQLRKLRLNCVIENSHFAVAAIIEIKNADGTISYVSGVNVENAEHNRLGLHAEQTALANAQSLLGEKIKLSKIYVMGAPDDIHEGSLHALADNFVKPCGHCRQLLLSRATNNAEVISITVNGDVSVPVKLPAQLPDAFSERDLATPEISAPHNASAASNVLTFHAPERAQISDIKLESTLSKPEILKYLRLLTPHIINPAFNTSPVSSCILKLSGESPHYAIGTLMQDVAFLTTDALFAAIANAATRFGSAAIKVEEAHFYSQSLSPSQLSASELVHLNRFTISDIPITFYQQDGTTKTYTLLECANSKLHPFMKAADVANHQQAAMPISEVRHV